MKNIISPAAFLFSGTALAFVLTSTLVEAGWKQHLAHAMGWHGDHGWESKGVTFGIKSKGMTAIIPFPLPIPIFSKDKKDDGGSGSNGGSNGNGNGNGATTTASPNGDSGGGSMKGGWEMLAGSDWWR